MNATRIRRIAALAVAVAGLTAVAAPMAQADSIIVGSSVSVPAPYNQNALGAGNSVFEAYGPTMIKVRYKITCVRGKVRRPGYPAMCQWSSGIFGTSATLSTVQGQGDVYPAGVNGYPLGTTFHAGTLREGQVGYDDWALVVRDDNIREATEQFKLSIAASNANSLVKTFSIIDND